jgi:hypothetical protein
MSRDEGDLFVEAQVRGDVEGEIQQDKQYYYLVVGVSLLRSCWTCGILLQFSAKEKSSFERIGCVETSGGPLIMETSSNSWIDQRPKQKLRLV